MITKTCPHCGATFICRHDNPLQCQCAGIALSPATRRLLHQTYGDACLCRTCLQSFAKKT
ncbi:MAG: cysteine-rich CWC family protein [Paludibacteraceae bacterium]|nr:cysteine-rich CWC family protein [Paludibacteraceae bacterium]